MKIQTKLIPHRFRNKYLVHTGNTTISTNSANEVTNVTSNWFYKDDKGNVHSKFPFIGDSEVSAYGSGDSSISGGDKVVVYDGLDSSDTTIALSANQGRVLKGLIDSGAGGGTVDLSNYYDKTDVDNKLKLKANTTYVDLKVADLVNGAPETLDTLKELSDALQTNKDAVDVLDKAITNKADKVHTHTTADITGLDTKLTKYDTHIADNVKHISADERIKWNEASTQKHTHSNKAVLDGIKSTDIINWNNKLDKKTWDNVFTVDNGDLKVKLNIIGDGEISAYGKGISSGGGVITIADNLTTSSSDVALSARQGVILKSMIDNKEINLDNYYNIQEVDSKLAPKADKTYIDSKVKDLNTAISGKANTKHTHLKADITDLDLTGYDSHIADNTKHITSTERTNWNNKVDKVDGKGLSTNDYTTTEKNKLAGIEEGALVNTINGIKGANEYYYRTGYVSISKDNIGLGNVDNTSDINKPISTATLNALDLKLDKSVWDKAFYYSGNDLRVKLNLIGDKEVSAYGKGGTSSGGGAVTIVDSLNSEAVDAALSANLGRILKNMIDTKEVNLDNYYDKDTSDSRYLQSIPSEYITESELANKGYITGYVNNYLSSVVGSGNGNVTFYRYGLTPLTLNLYHTHSLYLTLHLSLANYYTKGEVNTALEGKSDTGHTHSLYLTSSSLNGYAKTSQIPTNNNLLINGAGYLTEHQSLSNYYTKGEVDTSLNGKSNVGHTHSLYLTLHQSLTHLAYKDGSNVNATWDNLCAGSAKKVAAIKHNEGNYYTIINAARTDGTQARAFVDDGWRLKFTGTRPYYEGYGLCTLNDEIPISKATRKLIATDNRDVDELPRERKAGIYYDFKHNNKNGLYGGGTFNSVMTLRGYGEADDFSGGFPHQLGFTDNGDVWHRLGSKTAWGNWYKFWNSSNFNPDNKTNKQGQYEIYTSDVKPYNYIHLFRIANKATWSCVRADINFKSRYHSANLFIDISCLGLAFGGGNSTIRISQICPNDRTAEFYVKQTNQSKDYNYYDIYYKCGSWNMGSYDITNIGKNGDMFLLIFNKGLETLPEGVTKVEEKFSVNGNITATGEITAYATNAKTLEETPVTMALADENPRVYDGLDSTEQLVSLSANQGRILFGMINDLKAEVEYLKEQLKNK